MGLPASQRRILERIESALRGSDPRLAALFSIFTRLTCDEEMPRIEQVRARAAMFLIRIRCRLAAFARWFGAPRRARLRTAMFFPVALAIVASAVLVGAGFPSANRCPPTRTTADPAHARTSSKISSRTSSGVCTPLANPAILGR